MFDGFRILEPGVVYTPQWRPGHPEDSDNSEAGQPPQARRAAAERDGDAARASNGLRRTIGVLLQHAQQAGAIRDDVELPEIYALLVGTSRAAAHAHLDEEVRARMLAIVFDGLTPNPHTSS